MKCCKLNDGRKNLRGYRVLVNIDGELVFVTIVTHIRGSRWMVRGGLIIDESEFISAPQISPTEQP